MSEFDLFGKDIFGLPREQGGGPLQKRFIWPPFSVLDTKAGAWQTRKRAWLRLGIQSEMGRGGAKTFAIGTKAQWEAGIKLKKEETPGHAAWGGSGTSVFDPVLCELIYKWFCPEGGSVLDPFAGGSVRGIVAGCLGYCYTGIELRQEQVKANETQRHIVKRKTTPVWIIGDSINAQKIAPGEYDFLFSCPPYYDLEVYSEEPGELSAKTTYDEFLISYRQIIKNCANLLKRDRFACFVVGDIRDKKGYYRGFVADTINAFQECGLNLYNDAVLLNPTGSVTIRVGKQFEASRKLGKMHQNVLVFVKGNPKEATNAIIGKVDQKTKRRSHNGDV